jgi:hypothetical protein
VPLKFLVEPLTLPCTGPVVYKTAIKVDIGGAMRPLGPWASDQGALWPLGPWAFGSLGPSALGPLGSWALWLLGSWALGLFGSWALGLLGS